MPVIKEKDTQKLKMCKTVPKARVRRASNVMEKLSALQELQHPHISSITDLMEDDKNYYIISDYYMGGDVQDWLERMDEGNWLQEATCAAYVRQTLLALSHSHAAQVYHRDLKPSSLLLTTKLPDAVIKVVDFGIAHILDPDNSIIQSNPNEYTVPEVLKGTELKGGSTDLWSVGAIAHSLLVGNGSSVSSRRSWGFVKDDEGWSERSPLARDFVMRLLRPPHERPTAAKALHHPWIKGMMPINTINANQSNTKEARELRYKMLCYTLSVILLPAVVPHRDFDQLRVAFQQNDADRDGYIPRAIGLRLLLNRCQQNEAIRLGRGKQARKQKERWDRTVQGLRQPAVWAESRPNYGSQLPKGPRVVESAEVEHQETRPTEPEPASSSTRKREASVLSEEPTTTLEVVPSSDSAPRGVATLSQEIGSELKREAFARTVSSAVSVPSTELRIALDFHGVLDVEKAGGRSTQGISSDNRYSILNFLELSNKHLVTVVSYIGVSGPSSQQRRSDLREEIKSLNRFLAAAGIAERQLVKLLITSDPLKREIHKDAVSLHTDDKISILEHHWNQVQTVHFAAVKPQRSYHKVCCTLNEVLEGVLRWIEPKVYSSPQLGESCRT
eukprot:symbB.v1.2.020327.t1/scaffold1704.1/size105413/3